VWLRIGKQKRKEMEKRSKTGKGKESSKRKEGENFALKKDHRIRRKKEDCLERKENIGGKKVRSI